MRRLALLETLGGFLLWANIAVAHPLPQGDILDSSAGPDRGLVEGLLAVLIIGYSLGLARARSRTPRRWPISKWRVAAFYGMVTVVAVALLSPLDELSERYFAAHMGQHLLFVLVAAPLAAVSDAHLLYLRLLPLTPRRWLGSMIAEIPGMKPAGLYAGACWAFMGFAFVLVFWHMPAAYNWALRHQWGHAAEHLTLFIAAILFWRVVVMSGRRGLSPGVAIAMVSLIGLLGAFMGALIAFAPRPLYEFYRENPLDDQALAGVMMCIPASLIYLASTVWALARMLREKPRRGSNWRGTAPNCDGNESQRQTPLGTPPSGECAIHIRRSCSAKSGTTF